jgi:uncharacterized phage-associated protein
VKVSDPSILTPSDKKLRELALYISDRSQADPAFGATKLNKLLFYSDFIAYLNFGKSITGQKYFRLNNGPAPKRWIIVQKKMCLDGDLAIKKQDYFGFPQNRPIALRKADISRFDENEKSVIDHVIERYASLSASEISDASHGFIGWSLAKDKEDIPYPVSRVSKTDITDSIIKHGENLREQAVAALG